MDSDVLDSASGDAIARDWELPELPSTGNKKKGLQHAHAILIIIRIL